MKRFLIVLTALILGYLAYDTARYYLGWYIDLQPDAPVSAFMSTDAQHLYMDRGAGPEEFTVKGVNLGVGMHPGRVGDGLRRQQGDLSALVCPDAGNGREHRARLHYAPRRLL